MFVKKTEIPTREQALPGRSEEMLVPEVHYVNGNPLKPPFPAGLQTAMFGLGCFWGAEKAFWQTDGVYTTAVGYAGGSTPTRPIKRSAADRLATPRSSSSCSTRGDFL